MSLDIHFNHTSTHSHTLPYVSLGGVPTVQRARNRNSLEPASPTTILDFKPKREMLLSTEFLTETTRSKYFNHTFLETEKLSQGHLHVTFFKFESIFSYIKITFVSSFSSTYKCVNKNLIHRCSDSLYC